MSADRSPREQVQADVEQMRLALRGLIELAGMSRREVERRLAERGCGTDLGRLLRGRLALKMEHVLALCQVIGMDPLDFFLMTLPPRAEGSPLLQNWASVAPGLVRPGAGRLRYGRTVEDLAALIEAAGPLIGKLEHLIHVCQRAIAAPAPEPRAAAGASRAPTRTGEDGGLYGKRNAR